MINGYPWWMIALKLFVLGALAWGAYKGWRAMQNEKRRKAEAELAASSNPETIKGNDEQ